MRNDKAFVVKPNSELEKKARNRKKIEKLFNAYQKASREREEITEVQSKVPEAKNLKEKELGKLLKERIFIQFAGRLES